MEALILERIRELLTFRRWYRQNRWATWTDLRREHETELRALVRLARAARREAALKLQGELAEVDRLFPEQADPITAAMGWHDWQAAGPR